MQDLFVAENARGQGIAKRLVWDLHDRAKQAGWARLYWFAEESNTAAQNLYKNLGIRLNFSLHMLPTKEEIR
jgi:GNAT superfamily N-acetyltransferase